MLSVVAVLAALSIPLLTWPRWHSNINVSVREVPLHIMVIFGLMLVALAVWSHSRPLSLFILYACISSLFTHTYLAFATTFWIAMGIVFFILIQYLPHKYHSIVVFIITISVILEVLYTLSQAFQHDILFFGWKKTPQVFIHGTFGHHNFLGAYLAMASGVILWWALPFVFIGLWLANSLLSFAAFFVVLSLRAGRYVKKRVSKDWFNCLFMCYSVSVSLFIWWFFQLKSHDSFWSRLDAWSTAWRLTTFKTLIFGHGPGTWFVKIPQDQALRGWPEVFYQAHNEYIQLAFEFGLIGFIFLIWFVWENRSMFKYPYVVAIAISSLGIYTFHLASIASLGIVLLALATSKGEKDKCIEGSWRYYC